LIRNGKGMRLAWDRTHGLIRRWSKWRNDRSSCQQRFDAFGIEPGQRVLNIGGGGYPFPYSAPGCVASDQA